MKIITTGIFLLAYSITQILFAQNFDIQHSTPLEEEPVEGWVKLLQLDNGKTALLQITEKDGLRTRVYDANRKLVVDKEVEPQLNTKGKIKSKKTDIAGVFSIKDEIAVFINTYESRTPKLFRIVIDSGNGNVISEEAILTLEKRTIGIGPYVRYNPKKKFFVRKDPLSDNYAVAFFSESDDFKNKRFQVSHFDANHHLISEATYQPEDDPRISMRFIDMLVLGSDKVICVANIDDYDNSKGLFLYVLEKGASTLKTKQLDLNDKSYTNYGVIKYDDKENQILLLTLSSKVKFSYSQTPKLIILNPEDYSTLFSKVLTLPSVEKNFKSYANKKGDFNALPQSLHINEDGTYTVVYEEVMVYTKDGVVGSTLLGSNVVCILDSKTNIKSYRLIPKSHSLVRKVPKLYPAIDDYRPREIISSNSYKGYAYASSGTNKYMFFNDIIENIESVKDGKIAMVAGISGTDAFVCKVNENGAFDRILLYGEPEKRTHNFSMFVESNYSPKSGYFVTLNLELNRKKKSTVTWIKLN